MQNTVNYFLGIQSIAYNAIFLIVSKISEKILRFLYLIILARNLGPADIGLYNYGISYYLLFTPLVMWGIGQYLIISIGRNHSKQSELFSNTFIIRVLSTVVGFCAFLVLGLLTNEDMQNLILICIFSFVLFGRSFAIYGRNLFIGS